MSDPLSDPLTYAVMDIVKGSGLFQTTEQFHPIADIDTMRNMPPETVWPVVSAHTSTIGFTADTLTKELAIMVYFPFPKSAGGRAGAKFMDEIRVLQESETYVALLMDMVDWLIGKHKVPANRKGGNGVSAYNFNLLGDATITPIFLNEAGTEAERKSAIHDLVAVSLLATFTGTRALMSTPILQPVLAGTNRDAAITQP